MDRGPVLQEDLSRALEAGLRRHFGLPVGRILAGVASYQPHFHFDPARLRALRQEDTYAVQRAVSTGSLNGGTMLLIRWNMIASALLDDVPGVIHWATEGLQHCRQAEGPWPATCAEWQWVLDNVDQYIFYAKELKRFLNQMPSTPAPSDQRS